MASLESLQARSLAAQTVSGYIVDDKSIALELVYTGSNAVTSVTLTSATDLVLISTDTPTTVTSTFATDTTLGAVVDRINASANWKARILDGFRSTTTASSVLIPNSAVTAVTIGGESVYQIFIDGSEADSMAFRASYDRGVLRDDFGRVKTQVADRVGLNGWKQNAHRVKINKIKYSADVSGATVNGLRIYEIDSVTLAETEIWCANLVDDTVTSHDFGDFPIASREGNELVVAIVDSALADKSTNFLQVDYTRE